MRSTSFARLALALCAVSLWPLVRCATDRGGRTDSEQAERMFAFLKSVSAGEPDLEMLDAVLDTRGMELIVEQQNRRATIDKAQYRDLLLGLQDAEAPDIQPVDPGERAQLGVRRLKLQVWPGLKWATRNVELLENRLALVKGMDVADQARTIASSFLPEPLRETPEVFLVAGGRAGFYAGDDCIYMDLLNMSFSPDGVKPLVESDIIEFFAHEMHHIGFGALSRSRLDQLRLNEMQQRAYGFVSGLVAEGSATYLINGHRDIERIRSHRHYAEFFESETDLREICEDVLRSIEDGRIENDDDYSRATEPLLGMGVHAAGSLIVQVIDQAGGLDPVMGVLQDPRRLLLEYNDAARELMTQSESDSIYLFDEEVVNMVADMGLSR